MKMDLGYERQFNGYAIINPYGGIWTESLFKTPEEARDYLRRFWANIEGFDQKKWGVALATATIVLERDPGKPEILPLPK